jgi:hypothetical protein
MKQTLMLLFESSAFWKIPGEDKETTPGIYGKGLAHWLAERLREAGVPAQKVVAEDFGWCVHVRSNSHLLYVLCTNSQEDPNGWRVFAFADDSVVAKLIGKDKTAEELETLFQAVKQCLQSDPSVENLRERR